MKYIILQGDGMPDYPIEELGNKTPLEVAMTPNMDRLAQRGALGMLNTIPEGFPPGSDVGNLSILGYAPETCYTGRAPLEAASIGVELGPNDVAYRCNLVTLSKKSSRLVMEDYSSGHISSEEAAELIRFINENLGGNDIEFYHGVSYRNLMVWRNGNEKDSTTPPHDITGREIEEFLPSAADGFLKKMILSSYELLLSHPVNSKRIASGKNPANAIWLWGQGKIPRMPSFKEKYGISGNVISAVDLIRGIGVYAGLRVITVQGATGFLDTNFEGKADAALNALGDSDLSFVHVEAPDEEAHRGDFRGKILAIEAFDERLVGRVMAGLKWLQEEYTIVVLSDHPTPCRLKTHISAPVPFVIFNSSSGFKRMSGRKFSEAEASSTGIFIKNGWQLMEIILSGDIPESLKKYKMVK